MTTNVKPISTIKERPILFSAPMINALLEGRKTQTRRAMKPQPVKDYSNAGKTFGRHTWNQKIISEIKLPKYPYGKVGDRLWVRETFASESNWNIECEADYPPPFNDGRPIKRETHPEYGSYWEQCHYRATDSEPDLSYDDMEDPSCRWKPSIHMPRWASRINLEITDIRVERVQDIKKSDIYAEGVIAKNMPDEFSADSVLSVDGKVYLSWATAWINLWNSINEKRGFGWEKNPYVWCLTFKVL